MRPVNAHVPKINKAKAFTLVDMLRNGAQLTDDELDQLYVYFSPARATATRVKDAFAWVALAVGVKDVRPYLHHVTVRGGFMYGSDGKRCHRAATDLPDGHYCPATRAPVAFEGYAAPYERFFEVKGAVGFDIAGLVRETHNRVPAVRVPGGVAVQAGYWLDARATTVTTVDGRFIGESEFGDYAIMGLRA